MTVPRSENTPMVSEEWVVYWHEVVTVFKEFKSAPTVQLVAQPLPTNELVLKFLDKSETWVEKPTPSSQPPSIFFKRFLHSLPSSCGYARGEGLDRYTPNHSTNYHNSCSQSPRHVTKPWG